MRCKAAICILSVVLLHAFICFGASPKPTARSVGEGLICQCGCNMTVNGCNHPECSSRTEMQAMIGKEIRAGKDETTILQDFVLHYGVKVLATPPAKGFNLAVWVLPVIGVLGGLVVVIWVVRRLRKPSAETPSIPGGPVDSKLLQAVEEEMKSLGLGSRQ